MPRLPDQIRTERLLLLLPTPEDVEPLNDAVQESMTELTTWMPWATQPPSRADTRAFCERAQQAWEEDIAYGGLMVRAEDGLILGSAGYPRLDWDVPRFEIGCWCRTSMVQSGFASEATAALTRFAFESLDAARVELWIDIRNTRSLRVAERLGFQSEGVLRSWARDNAGGLCDMGVYSLLDIGGLRGPR